STFAIPFPPVGDAVTVTVAGAVNAWPWLGLVRPTLTLFDAAVYASISAIRLQLATAPVTHTRIAVVVTLPNAIFRQTRLLPLTAPPGTVTHCVPVQYCARKSVRP